MSPSMGERVATLAIAAAVLLAASPGASGQAAGPAAGEPAPQASGLTLRVVGAGHTAPIRRIAMSPDQRTLVSAGDDRSVRVWSVPDARLLQTLWPSAAAGEGGRLYGAAFSPGGDEFVVGGDPPGTASDAANRLYVYRTGNGQLARAIAMPPGQVRRLLWTRDGRSIVACGIGPDRVTVFDREGGLQYERPLDGPCYALAELPDGTLLVGDGSGVVRRLSAGGGRWSELPEWKTSGVRVWSMAVSPDGRHVAIGFFDDPDNPASARVALVEVLDAASGRAVKTLRFPSIPIGNLRAVGWSADGTRILAGGSLQRQPGRFLAIHVGWPAGDVAEEVIGSDSVFDVLPLGPDGFVLANADTTWSVVRPLGAGGAPSVVRQVDRQAADLRGASMLRLSPDARHVGFTVRDGEQPMQFDLPARRLLAGSSPQPAPTHSTWRLRTDRWQNQRNPTVAGRAVDLGPLDVARAVAVAPDASAAYLGSNQALRRLGADASVAWTVNPGVETRAVNVSGDGRVVVTAMLDGTVRWWRAADGRALLTLYVQLDGRWVVWTDGGYYDASPGAESLIGFVRDRIDAPGADFFSLGRFRDARLRPDVIDRVLETLDPDRAVELANGQRVALAQRIEDAQVREQVIASATPVPVEVHAVPTPRVEARPAPPPVEARPAPPPVEVHPVRPPQVDVRPQPAATPPRPANVQASMPAPPPVVSLAERRARPVMREVGLDFFLRALGEPATGVEVRVDGRPVQAVRAELPARQDGTTLGRIVLTLPERAARITVMAQAGALRSEPVDIDVDWPVPVASPAAGTATAAPSAPSGSAASQPSAASPAASPAAAQGSAATPLTPPPAGRRLFVVSIGISDYQRRDYGNLRFAAKDARDFAAALAGQQGRLYRSVQTRVLTDALASRAAVLEALAWLRDAVGAEDTAVLFLAGHGINDPAGRYHFLTHDADVARPSATAVGEAELRATLTQLRGRALLFADTCHAGGVVGRGVAVASEFARLANALSSPEAGVIVFASSTWQQESQERLQDGNGVFTRAVLDGLSGRADLLGQGQVTHQGLGYFVAQTVKQRTGGAQTPVYVSPLGNVDYALVALR